MQDRLSTRGPVQQTIGIIVRRQFFAVHTNQVVSLFDFQASAIQWRLQPWVPALKGKNPVDSPAILVGRKIRAQHSNP